MIYMQSFPLCYLCYLTCISISVQAKQLFVTFKCYGRFSLTEIIEVVFNRLLYTLIGLQFDSLLNLLYLILTE